MAWTKRSGIMLCQPLDEKNLGRNFKGSTSMIAQPKLDGVRAWVKWEENIPLLISSEGNVYESVPHVQLALQKWAEATGERLSFDGELYNHESSFEDIISITKRKGENLRDDFTNITYHIFDYKSSEAQVLRLLKLVDLFKLWDELAHEYHDYLTMVPSKAVAKEQISSQLDAYIKQGYEGIILRNPSAPYVEKRSWTILKWKPSKHDWYKVVRVKEAVSEHGEHYKRLGSVVCQDDFGNEFSIGLGLGITQEEAEKLWEIRETLIGKYADVYYQNLTQAGVPRFGKCSLFVDTK